MACILEVINVEGIDIFSETVEDVLQKLHSEECKNEDRGWDFWEFLFSSSFFSPKVTQ